MSALKVDLIKISELKLDDNNARMHTPENLSAIAGSLTQFGQRKPIVISQDNTVVAGNGTLTAAKSLGWVEIEVVRVPNDWDKNTIKAFALADNRTAELAEWDKDTMARQIIELEDAGIMVAAFGFEETQLPPTFEPVDEIPRLDLKDPKFCPNCGHDITHY